MISLTAFDPRVKCDIPNPSQSHPNPFNAIKFDGISHEEN